MRAWPGSSDEYFGEIAFGKTNVAACLVAVGGGGDAGTGATAFGGATATRGGIIFGGAAVARGGAVVEGAVVDEGGGAPLGTEAK